MDLEKFNIPRYLGTLPLFSQLGEQERTRLADGCQLRRLERGKLIFRMGDPCEEFHVTVIGQVKLFALSPTGVEKVIEICGISRVLRFSRIDRATAAEPSMLCRL